MNQTLQIIENKFRLFIRDSSSSVRTMVNQFEKKKNAYDIKKTTHKKSGLLDMNRIANYRTSENIFQKRSIRPGQKNHKIVVLIDWSGSIDSQLEPIIMQTINIAQFCKKTGVDMTAFAFIDNCTMRSRVHYNDRQYDMNNSVNMMEMINTDLPQKEFESACLDLYSLSQRKFRESYYYKEEFSFNLNRTPLNEALVCVREYISGDRKNYHSYNLIVLSDGQGHNLSRKEGYYADYCGDVTYIDGLTNKTVKKNILRESYTKYETSSLVTLIETDMLLGIIKSMQVSTTMFYFYSGRPDMTIKKLSDKIQNGVILFGKNVRKNQTAYLDNLDEGFHVHVNSMFKLEKHDSKYLEMDEEEFDEDYNDDTEDMFKDKNTDEMSISQLSKHFSTVVSDEKTKRFVACRVVDALCSNYA